MYVEDTDKPESSRSWKGRLAVLLVAALVIAVIAVVAIEPGTSMSGTTTNKHPVSSITMGTATQSVTSIYVGVTFIPSGLNSAAIGVVITIDGVNMPYIHLPYSLQVTAGTTVTFKWASVVASSVSGQQFVLSGSSQTSPYVVTSNAIIIGTYIAKSGGNK